MSYHYTFAAHADEEELCALEQRRLFGREAGSDGLLSTVAVGVDRSPFVRTRLTIAAMADNLDALTAKLAAHPPSGLPTFKVVCLRGGGLSYGERRAAERRLGAVVAGRANMKTPHLLYGAVPLQDGTWLFGTLEENGAVWLAHNDKPQHYSTALGTRTARALVNIAIPQLIPGLRAVDPCCGIGTVLLEAASMGIEMDGFDLNPLAVAGARENLRRFGYDAARVSIADMRTLQGRYETAVLDLPYNKCSVLPASELRDMLASLRRIARTAIVVSIEPVEAALAAAGWRIVDQCTAAKGSFIRRVLVCT